MKTSKLYFTIFLALAIFSLNSCTKDEAISKPEINITELGYENSGIAYLGSDLHIEADIVAEGKIERIIIEIHHEGEHGKKTTFGIYEGEWEVDTTYIKFSGLKNTTFHEHLEVSTEAETGDYHFHFEVIDMDGNQTVIERELQILQPDDNVAPVINVTVAPSSGQSFSNGEKITISGNVSDDKALGGMYIGLVRENQNLTDADVNATSTITLLHTHEFDSQTEHVFQLK